MKISPSGTVFGLCVFFSAPVFAQSGSDLPSGDADPIAVATAHILKGQTNNMQRRAIRQEWLTVAAQQAEDFLRTSAFTRIIEFVRKNHELFESIYAGLRTAKEVVATGQRVQSVISLQRKLLMGFAATGEILAASDHFTVEELRAFTGTLEGVLRDTEANFDLLITLFRGTSSASLTDMERYEVLATIEQRLTANLRAVGQLNRYVTYLNTNRGVRLDNGLGELLVKPQ